jgi:cobyrinic acid a,c-diamide synthase
LTPPNPARGWLVAAPRSGAGKTTVTLAIAAALRRRGLVIRMAKSGPDYIDPMFHAAASGAAGVNLDSWAMPPATIAALAAQAAHGADILLAESAMGLFDGVGGPPGRTGAAADLAVHLHLPVLLVLDVSGQSQSAAAIALGMDSYRPGLRVGGVILNRVGSDRHRRGAATAIEALGMPVLGALPRDAAFSLPERHLGLVQAGEHSDLPAFLERLAQAAETHLDLDALLAKAAPLQRSDGGVPSCLQPPGQRVAIARDAAFSFIYPHLLQAWRKAGAEIVFFSPLADKPPPQDCDACWLPGGYPELHAAGLAAAGVFQTGLQNFARTKPVHGECGGYMVLGTRLQDAQGAWHAMPGLLGHATSFAVRKMILGYREATLLADGPLGPAGMILRGHEFHYARLVEPGPDQAWVRLRDGLGQDLGLAGSRRGNVTASFFHAIAEHRVT